MRVTVCELRNEPEQLAEDWATLAAHVRAKRSELVLLPEMPFSRWLAATKVSSASDWAASVRAHGEWMARLEELGARAVATTRPVVENGAGFNEGVVWEAGGAPARPVHRKRYLPDEEGFWEASWYTRGDARFSPVDVVGTRIGFLICTELWFQRHARDYSQQSVHILACPRATLAPSTDKWLAGGRAAAVVSGAFCLSSNFSGRSATGATWGGTGWIVEPEEGDVLGITSSDTPFLTVDVDIARADRAKSTYPRYVCE